MTQINQRRLERKRRKQKERREKFRKLKDTSQNPREIHAGKSSSEIDDYIRFIETNSIRSTNDVTEEKKKIKNEIKIVGEKTEKRRDSTDDVIVSEKRFGKLPKKKLGKWDQFKRVLQRSWANELVKNLFSLPFAFLAATLSATLVAFISYHFFTKEVKEDIERINTEISNPQSDFRKAIVDDLFVRTGEKLNSLIELEVLKQNKDNKVFFEAIVDERLKLNSLNLSTKKSEGGN